MDERKEVEERGLSAWVGGGVLREDGHSCFVCVCVCVCAWHHEGV